MKIIKYVKDKGNLYKIITDKNEYKIYDDILIKHELLLKKEISDKEFQDIIKENNLMRAYYDSIKYLNLKLRTEKEIKENLVKKGYSNFEITKTIERLNKENYLNHDIYIEAYIHDRLLLYTEGLNKITNDLLKLGFSNNEISSHLENIDNTIFIDKINKYITKKLKANKKSAIEFKRKITNDLINKGFNKSDITSILSNCEITENNDELSKIINKLYQKYSQKYDLYTTKNKIKNYLYTKGYQDIDIDTYIEKNSL